MNVRYLLISAMTNVLANIFLKGPEKNFFRLLTACTISLVNTTTELFRGSIKLTSDNMRENGYSCVPVKFVFKCFYL